MAPVLFAMGPTARATDRWAANIEGDPVATEETQLAILDRLSRLGFEPVERLLVPCADAASAYLRFAERRPALDYEIDRVVRTPPVQGICRIRMRESGSDPSVRVNERWASPAA